MPRCVHSIDHFNCVTDTELLTIISGMKKTTCSSDIFLTILLMSHLYAIIHILQHIVTLCLTTGDFVDSFQSVYRAGHSCESALLRVYNDIVTTFGQGNGSFLVLLHMSGHDSP